MRFRLSDTGFRSGLITRQRKNINASTNEKKRNAKAKTRQKRKTSKHHNIDRPGLPFYLKYVSGQLRGSTYWQVPVPSCRWVISDPFLSCSRTSGTLRHGVHAWVPAGGFLQVVEYLDPDFAGCANLGRKSIYDVEPLVQSSYKASLVHGADAHFKLRGTIRAGSQCAGP